MAPDSTIQQAIHFGWVIETGSEDSRAQPVGNGEPCSVDRFRRVGWSVVDRALTPDSDAITVGQRD